MQLLRGTILFLAMLRSSLLFAEDSTNSVMIHVDKKSDSQFCPKLKRVLNVLITAQGRFKPIVERRFSNAKRAARHKIDLFCSGGRVKATWRVKDNREQHLFATESQASTQKTTPAEVASSLLADLLEKLSWEGEVLSKERFRAKELKDQDRTNFVIGDGDQKDYELTSISVGSNHYPFMQSCTLLELHSITRRGRLIKLKLAAKAILLRVDQGSSVAQVYQVLDRKAFDDDALFFTYALPSKEGREGAAMIEKCRSLTGLGEDSTLDRLLKGDLGQIVSSETVEITDITQTFGAMAVTVRSSNGFKSPLIIAATGRNTVSLGNFFNIDVALQRHVVRKPFEPQVNIDPEYTDAYGMLYLRIPFGRQQVLLGGGAMVEKISVPISVKSTASTTTVESFQARGLSQKGAIGLRYGFDAFGILGEFSLLGSLTKEAPQVTAATDFGYYLTKTWFVGARLKYDSVRAESDITALGAGLHIGFKLDAEN